MCGLYVGGLQATAELLTLCDSEVSASDSAFIATLRRYACMTLTNLTYADTVNKTTLCQMSAVLKTLVALLRSPDEDLRQVCMVLRYVCTLLSVCLSVTCLSVCVSGCLTLLQVLEICSVPFFSHRRSEGWPHRGHTFSIYLCPLSL